jgi:preprotein translocase SecF subunit
MIRFDFIKNSKFYFAISLSLIALAFIFTAVFGVKLDIEFKGGTIVKYSYDGEISADEFDANAEKILGQSIDVTQGEDFTSHKKTIQISLVSESGLTADKQFELTKSLKETYLANNLELVSSSDVNPSSGRDFFNKCLVAVAAASLLIILYIAWRFKRISGWSAGVMAVVALLHDILMVYATFVIFRIPINANFMAVVLTILGYSINDTIVIYDRIRENKKIMPKSTSTSELVNISINQSLGRSINTSLCTVTSTIVVSIIALIFGVESILSFSFPMTIGIISGAYSSICIAGPLWVLWKERKPSKKSK